MLQTYPQQGLPALTPPTEPLGQVATDVWNKNGTVTVVAIVAVLGIGAYFVYKLMKW